MLYSKNVELSGHILDSLILSDVLDEVLEYGGEYEIMRLEVGYTPENPSFARIRVAAGSEEVLERILRRLRELGAEELEA